MFRSSHGVITRYSIANRLLAIFLAGVMSLPLDVHAQEPVPPNPKPVAQQPHETIYDRAASISTNRLACKDSKLTGKDTVLGPRNSEAGRWGDISVAQPKIWQFERVSALLDGLLRDVEGVSLADLTQLDPSQQNGAALKFVQSALEVGVQYDQAAAVNAANTLSNYNALHASQLQQLDHYNTYMQTLTAERDRLASQYSAASNEVNALQALQAAGPLTDAQQKQLAEAQSRQTNTQTSLTSVNSLIAGAGAAPTLSAPPTLTGTSVGAPASGSPMSSSLSGFSDVLNNLPQGVKDNLSAALKSPSYPATKRMDNFITLLYERLAREIAVLQDDLSRDPDNVAFLIQFDVGLYPSKKAKDHVARVEFNLDCPGCKVYSLYPGQSSYNIANYSGSSKRNTFWGNVLTLIGLGVSASYRRQTDTLQGSLVQSVYTAGFQNGVMTDEFPNERTHEQVNANQAEQSFGWYYGPAPFDQLVSPGIRSTFALITVPSELIRRTEDSFGNTEACLPFHIDAGWASRNDPMAQDGYISVAGDAGKILAMPAYVPTRNKLLKEEGSNQSTPGEERVYDESVLTLQTSVKLPIIFDDNALVARREHKLHVLRMEYNTVTEPDQAANATVVQTTVQTNTQVTNPATGQSTSQTATQTTGTSVAVTSPANTGPAGSATNLDPLPCPKGMCSAVVVKLDRPIDPNLVVTVRGQPLMRVRDWRGRATSVLPPAQSGTDLTGAATKPLAQTRSLLESDQFAPNTWFPLNSHELLLNISLNVATDEEFPVIQLADPSGSFIIPHDLRRGFSELIINGFRLKPLTRRSIQQETARQNWKQEPALDLNEVDSPISTGPYAFSTFLPLFTPEPAPRRLFALIGETGDDLLIGFLPVRMPRKDSDKVTKNYWLESRSQVILEDRDMDFAWSLSCDVQGELLACRLPREEISRVYRNFLIACPTKEKCPGLGEDRQSLIKSLKSITPSSKTSTVVPSADDVPGIRRSEEPVRCDENTLRPVNLMVGPRRKKRSNQPATDGCRQTEKHEETRVPETKEIATDNMAEKLALSKHDDLTDLPHAYVSTMQLWVEQADEEGKNVFYSPEPVHIGFLPLSQDYWRNTLFKPWELESAEGDCVTLHECSYLPGDDQSNIEVSLLGVRSWQRWLEKPSSAGASDQCGLTQQISDRNDWAKLTSGYDVTVKDNHCGRFNIPTAALVNDPVVFSMEFPPHPSDKGAADLQRTTIAIPRSRLAPRFRESQIQVRPEPPSTSRDKGQIAASVWQVDIPVVNSACGDEVELTPTGSGSTASGQITWEWRNGQSKLPCLKLARPKPSDPKSTKVDNSAWDAANKNWKEADKSDRIRLHLEIPKTALSDLRERVDVVRTTSDGVDWVVATLPDLRRLLLPSQLTLEAMGSTQFALRGDHAEVIDAVALQNGDGKTGPLPTAHGVDFALVTLPSASDSKPKSDTSASGDTAGNSSSMQIAIDAAKDNTGHIKFTTQSSSTPAKPGSGNTKPAPAPADDTTPSKALGPGSYAVLPLVQVGTVAADAKAKSDADKKLQQAETKLTEANKALDNAKTPAEKAKASKAVSQAKAARDDAKTAAAKAAEPQPQYMPLTVTDDKGKPLIFTIPAPKKDTAAPQASTTVTGPCTAPCMVSPCVPACLTPTQAAPAKSP